MYLADTNIFLEALLEQEKKDDVQTFLQTIDLSEIFMTDFSLHSIGIILYRLKCSKLFSTFIGDIIVDGIDILSLSSEELITVNLTADKFSLDFDDAYQYSVATKYDLQIISFDTDFDRTDRKRMEPIEVI